MIQTININITEAMEAVKSKEALDGLIFAYMIKTTFVSGRTNNATTRRVCEFLGIGNRIYRRGLKSALERGYVRCEGNDIIAVSINSRLDYLYPIQKELKRKSERAISETPHCPFKFTELRKIIRKAVIENHILKQNDFAIQSNVASIRTAKNNSSVRKDGLNVCAAILLLRTATD